MELVYTYVDNADDFDPEIAMQTPTGTVAVTLYSEMFVWPRKDCDALVNPFDNASGNVTYDYTKSKERRVDTITWNPTQIEIQTGDVLMSVTPTPAQYTDFLRAIRRFHCIATVKFARKLAEKSSIEYRQRAQAWRLSHDPEYQDVIGGVVCGSGSSGNVTVSDSNGVAANNNVSSDANWTTL